MVLTGIAGCGGSKARWKWRGHDVTSARRQGQLELVSGVDSRRSAGSRAQQQLSGEAFVRAAVLCAGRRLHTRSRVGWAAVVKKAVVRFCKVIE